MCVCIIRLHIPVGYHGRASSIVVSGTDLHRPAGQRITPQNKTEPFFAPSAKLDYELEVVCIGCNGLLSKAPNIICCDRVGLLVPVILLASESKWLMQANTFSAWCL